MKQERINRMRGASYLLPDPSGEVVRELLDEIERLQPALTDCVTEMSDTPRTDAILSSKTEPVTAVKEFMRTLERELAAMTEECRLASLRCAQCTWRSLF